MQAPFLITDNRLTRKVAQDQVARTMLAGLTRANLVGLGLYPDELRHPVGIRRPLDSMADFQGAQFRAPISNTSDALFRALGAEPVHSRRRLRSGLDSALWTASRPRSGERLTWAAPS